MRYVFNVKYSLSLPMKKKAKNRIYTLIILYSYFTICLGVPIRTNTLKFRKACVSYLLIDQEYMQQFQLLRQSKDSINELYFRNTAIHYVRGVIVLFSITAYIFGIV